MEINTILYCISIISAFRIFYYAIGEPSHEYNPQALLSGYTFWIAYNTLVKYRCADQIKDALRQSQLHYGEQKVLVMNDIKRQAVQQATPLFNVEMIKGICPTCTFFWVSIALILVPLLIMGQPFIIAFSFAMISNILSKLTIKYS